MSSKATAVTQTESDGVDMLIDDSSDESLASIQSYNKYFEDSYIGDAHPENLYPEQQITSNLHTGVSEVTNAMELLASSPLHDRTEQDLLAAYNAFSTTAASQSKDGGQNQGLPFNDSRRNCLSPSSMGFTMSM